MRRIGLIVVVFVTGSVVLGIWPTLSALRTTSAYAAEEQEANANGTDHEEGLVQSIGKWLNFFALVSILYLFLKKTLKVQEKFKNDVEEIENSIESARKAKEEAEKRLEELESRMRQMDDEAERLKAKAVQEAEEEKKRILESAQREAERVVETAHREIDAEVRLARKELRKRVADLAVAQGRKIIEEEINDSDQERLIRSYIDEFGK